MMSRTRRDFLSTGIRAAALVGTALSTPALLCGDALAASAAANTEWRFYAGTLGATHYAPLDQINASNVKDLKIDGTLYGAYHYEPDTICFSNQHILTAPRIGWIRSINNGASWEDLGFVISADPCRINCLTKSPWDSGGTGDFVFYLDQKKEYFYFYGTSYDPEFAEQGVFAARLLYADRNDPAGKAMKWHNGGWNEPGIWGHVTPVFPAERDYHRPDGAMFWGPAIHWNTYLQMYVMVLNHAIDTKLTEDGIYISYNPDLGDPTGWSKPQMILDRAGILRATTIGKLVDDMLLIPRGVYYGELRPAPDGTVIADTLSSGWYPQVIGTEKGETDKLCGRTCRLFMTGMSRLQITFLKPGEKPD